MILTSPTAQSAVDEEGDLNQVGVNLDLDWDGHKEKSMHFNEVIFTTGDANNMMKFSVWFHA